MVQLDVTRALILLSAEHDRGGGSTSNAYVVDRGGDLLWSARHVSYGGGAVDVRRRGSSAIELRIPCTGEPLVIELPKR